MSVSPSIQMFCLSPGARHSGVGPCGPAPSFRAAGIPSWLHPPAPLGKRQAAATAPRRVPSSPSSRHQCLRFLKLRGKARARAPATGASVMGREVSPPPLGPASVLLKAGSLPVALTAASSLRRGVLNVPASLQTRSCTPRSGCTQAAGAQGPAPSPPGKVASAPSRPGKMHVPQPNAPGAPELRHSRTPLSGRGEPQAPHRPYCFNRKRASEVAGDGHAFPERPR